jgi:hypothetical protein
VFDYAGGIHFHSSYSYDARVPLSQILKDASKSGLSFAIVTDHFRLDARTDGYEGYHDNVLLIVGQEISPRYNHYVALGAREPIVVWKSEANAQKIIDEVSAQGGFGFISHPDHSGAPLMGSRAYPWIDWDVHGYAGMGIWDLASDWGSALTSPWRTLFACLRPARALKGPQAKTLARWDQLTQKNHCVAIGEIDNHAHQRSFFGFTHRIFPFEFAFRTIRTHVLLQNALTKDAQEDERMILGALRQGQSYVSLDFWNDPTGFSFTIFDAQTKAWPGGEITRQGPTLLEAKLPSAGKLRLVRDGHVVKEEARRSALQWDVDLPGVYRVEAQQYAGGCWRPWIYSNPIWVK